MRRVVLLAGVLAVPVLPVLVSAPAQAADNVICVAPAGGAGCNQTVATIQAAVTAANGNALDDTIQLGAATYTPPAPILLDGFTHAVTLKGTGEAGAGGSYITLAPSASNDQYVTALHASVQSLAILMEPSMSAGDQGLNLQSGSSADHVVIDDLTQGVKNADGLGISVSTASHVQVRLSPAPLSGTFGVFSAGGDTITDSSFSGSVAFELSDPGAVSNLSRVQLRADGTGVVTDGGTINVDDALIDLGTSTGTGILAANFNGGGGVLGPVITANHVTIVGGAAGSRGARVAATTPGFHQVATLSLTNSIVRGPATSLIADASNQGGGLAPSNATLNVAFTDFQTTGGTISPVTGAGGIVQGSGNLVNVDPGFVSATDRHLTPGSAVVDKGDPAVGGPATDLDGAARVVDGDGNGSAVRDMGAYELGDTSAPDTTIDSGPTGGTSDSTPTFTFSSEAGATFECKVDGGSFTGCTSPFTTPVLADGQHAFAVQATDAAHNTDPSPAARTFVVDTVPPDTTISAGPPPRGNKAAASIAFTSEPGATFECSLDGGGFAACTSPASVTVTEGSHIFAVRAKDTNGIVDPTPVTRTWVVDTTPPVVTIKKAPPKVVTAARVKVKFLWTRDTADDTSWCRLDKGDWKPCTSPYKANVKVGKHTIQIRVTDAAGNDSKVVKVKFKRVKTG